MFLGLFVLLFVTMTKDTHLFTKNAENPTRPPFQPPPFALRGFMLGQDSRTEKRVRSVTAIAPEGVLRRSSKFEKIFALSRLCSDNRRNVAVGR